MKLKNLIYVLLLTTAVQGYSGGKNTPFHNYLAPSPRSVAKTQMIYDLNARKKEIVFSFSQLSDSGTNNGGNGEFKNRGKAFIRSLILPGSGEHYLGKKTLAKAFLITEVTLWIGYVAFNEYGKWIRNDAYAFAATHSGAKTDSKPSQFFVDIGNYGNVNEYNDAKQRMRQFEKVYSSEDYYWQWEDNQSRQKFENMRISSDQAINRSVFVLGGIFANHLLSAVDAVWQTHRHNKKLNQNSEKKVSINIESDFKTGELSLNIQKLF
jgi:hypothetical protein